MYEGHANRCSRNDHSTPYSLFRGVPLLGGVAKSADGPLRPAFAVLAIGKEDCRGENGFETLTSCL